MDKQHGLFREMKNNRFMRINEKNKNKLFKNHSTKFMNKTDKVSKRF